MLEQPPFRFFGTGFLFWKYPHASPQMNEGKINLRKAVQPWLLSREKRHTKKIIKKILN
jgi:hypothetical protein